jgi:DNA gyrase subunit A
LIVTEYGFGKLTPISEYPRHNRGGGGVITSRITEKTGRVAAARMITEADSDLMIISASGVVIRTDVSTVKTSGRATQGVILMDVNDGDTVVAVATTNGKKTDEEAEEDAEQNTTSNAEENAGQEVPVTAQAILEGADDSAEESQLQADSDIEQEDPEA